MRCECLNLRTNIKWITNIWTLWPQTAIFPYNCKRPQAQSFTLIFFKLREVISCLSTSNKYDDWDCISLNRHIMGTLMTLTIVPCYVHFLLNFVEIVSRNQAYFHAKYSPRILKIFKFKFLPLYFDVFWCQQQVSGAWISNCTPQNTTECRFSPMPIYLPRAWPIRYRKYWRVPYMTSMMSVQTTQAPCHIFRMYRIFVRFHNWQMSVHAPLRGPPSCVCLRITDITNEFRVIWYYGYHRLISCNIQDNGHMQFNFQMRKTINNKRAWTCASGDPY